MTEGSSQGLFVIVAVVIFGIFVMISYLLFRENLRVGLASIFEDSVEDALENSEFGEMNYHVINTKHQEIVVGYTILTDGTVKIVSSGFTKEDVGTGSPLMTSSLEIPDTIKGRKVTVIGKGAFKDSLFKGTLKLPKFLKRIENHAFYVSKFTGILDLPESLEEIGLCAFEGSIFTGAFKLPKGVTQIQAFAFRDSKFTGVPQLHTDLTLIGHSAFRGSVFTGDFKHQNLEYIGGLSFYQSKFSGTIQLPKIKELGGTTNNHNSGDTSLYGRAFYTSTFSEVELNNEVKQFGENNIGGKS